MTKGLFILPGKLQRGERCRTRPRPPSRARKKRSIKSHNTARPISCFSHGRYLKYPTIEHRKIGRLDFRAIPAGEKLRHKLFTHQTAKTPFHGMATLI